MSLVPAAGVNEGLSISKLKGDHRLWKCVSEGSQSNASKRHQTLSDGGSHAWCQSEQVRVPEPASGEQSKSDRACVHWQEPLGR